MEKRERSRSVVGYRAMGFLALSLVLWIVDSGLLLKSFGPQLEREVIGRIGEESGFLSGDLKGRVGFVQERLRPLVRDGARVRDCGAHKSVWELNQVFFCHSLIFSRINCLIIFRGVNMLYLLAIF